MSTPRMIGNPESPETLSPNNVADDKEISVQRGDFVINAPAVAFAGKNDIINMLDKASETLRKSGKSVSVGGKELNKESLNIMISDGEVVIPKQLAEVIGYDLLEKINNRGKKTVSKLQKEQKAEEPAPREGFVAPPA
jgi:hypothetical protein